MEVTAARCLRCGFPLAHRGADGCARCLRASTEERQVAAVDRLARWLEIREVIVEAQVHPARSTRVRPAEPLGGRLHFAPDGTPAGRSERWRRWADV